MMLANISTSFADKRLDDRFATLCDQLSGEYCKSIPSATASKGQTKAAYRFFNNERVRLSDMLGAHHQACRCDLAQLEEPLLCISDSTELDYTGKRAAAHLGPLTYTNRRGMLAHTSILVRESGLPVGIMNQQFIIRDQDYFGKADERSRWPIEKKESYRWLHDFKQMQSRSEQQQQQMIFVADREADMLEIYNARRCASITV